MYMFSISDLFDVCPLRATLYCATCKQSYRLSSHIYLSKSNRKVPTDTIRRGRTQNIEAKVLKLRFDRSKCVLNLITSLSVGILVTRQIDCHNSRIPSLSSCTTQVFPV